MDPSVLSLITGALESVVNTALRYDPASQQKLATLTDILAIESDSPRFTLYCHGSEDGIRLMTHCEAPITTQLTGSPLALFSLLKKPTTLANSGVELSGSVGLLQEWQQLLDQLDIDWEDAISGVLGDIAGPLFAQNLRKGAAWASTQKEEQFRLLKEYLPEEVKVIPSKSELDHFYEAVNSTTLDTDRISARLSALQQKVSALKLKKTKKENTE